MTDFDHLNARRRNLTNATKTLAVVRVKKDGKPSKFMRDAQSFRFNAFTADEADKAEARRVELEKLNPGNTYVIIDI